MALEIPAVMAPVGVNSEIVTDGENGFLADSDQEWINKLSLLIENQELRLSMGKKGRQTVVERFSFDSQKDRYILFLNDLVN